MLSIHSKFSLFLPLILAILLVSCSFPSTPKAPAGPHFQDRGAVDNSNTPYLDSQSAAGLEPAASLPEKADTSQALAQDQLPQDSLLVWHLKDIPLAVSDSELDLIAQTGFQLLLPEWGVDDAQASQVLALLDRLESRGLAMVLDGGFSAGAWGFAEDGTDQGKSPVWQEAKMSAWVNALKAHPALYAWDISNEAGENFDLGRHNFRLSLADLQTASSAMRSLDPTHPLILRMHYWDDEDGDFNQLNPFSPGLADIVVLNLYSNYSLDGATPLLPEMIQDSASLLINKITAVDGAVDIWLSLAAYRELPFFVKPSPDALQRDILAALRLNSLSSLGFFGWGSLDYGWYLPRDGADLLTTINQSIN